MVGAIGGCSSSKKTPSTEKIVPDESPKADDVKQRIGTGGVTIQAKSADLKPVWNVVSEKSVLDITESGSIRGTLSDVKGKIYSKSEVASRFTADNAFADQKKQSLELSSNVQLIDSTGLQKLTAKAVTWIAEIKMLQAKGDVRYFGPNIETDPMEVIWCTPDLKTFGTPTTFKDNPTMKKWIAPFLTASLAAVSLSQTDGNSNMVLKFATWQADTSVQNQISFVITGKPASGVWKGQGLSTTAQKILGTAIKGTKGYYLSKAILSGGVRTTKTSKSADGSRTTVLTSGTADFVGNETKGTLGLSDNIAVTSSLADGTQWMQLTGSRGTFVMDMSAGATSQIQSGELFGPITMRLKSSRMVNGKKELSDISGSASQIQIVEGGREIRLVGGVILSGTGPAFAGSMKANMIRITTDAKGKIQSVYAEGEPGQGEFRETP